MKENRAKDIFKYIQEKYVNDKKRSSFDNRNKVKAMKLLYLAYIRYLGIYEKNLFTDKEWFVYPQGPCLDTSTDYFYTSGTSENLDRDLKDLIDMLIFPYKNHDSDYLEALTHGNLAEEPQELKDGNFLVAWSEMAKSGIKPKDTRDKIPQDLIKEDSKIFLSSLSTDEFKDFFI